VNKGGRPANPTPFWNPVRKIWQVRITERKGEASKAHDLPGIPYDREDAAKIVARDMNRALGRGEGVAPDAGETVTTYAGRWLKARAGKIASTPDNKAHLNGHILPVIGAYGMADVTAKHIEGVGDTF
jgi:hypothetical protein